MATRDLFQSINEMAPEAIQKIVDRLEFRGRDANFVAMREAYLDQHKIDSAAHVLGMGCGTGGCQPRLSKETGFCRQSGWVRF